MKKLILLLFPLFALAQTPNDNYYGVWSLATGYLSQNIQPTDTTAFLQNGQCFSYGINTPCGTAFTSNQIISIDSEQLFVCNVGAGPGNTTQLTFGQSSCPNINGRGFGGTTAVQHFANHQVISNFTPYSYNALKSQLNNFVNNAIPINDNTFSTISQLQSACIGNITINITKTWQTGSFDYSVCNLIFIGNGTNKGILQPTNGSVVNVGNFSCGVSQKCFDTSVAGPGSIKLNQGYARPEWFGAVVNNAAVNSANGFQAAFHSMPSTDGGIHFRGEVELAGGIYTISAQATGACCNYALSYPPSDGLFIKGNGSQFDVSHLSTGLGVITVEQNNLQTGQSGCGITYDCQYQYEGECFYSCQSMNPANPGDNTLTVSDGTKFIAGQVIYYQGGRNGSMSAEPNAEMNEVVLVTGNVLTLKWPVNKPFPSSFNDAFPIGIANVDYLTSKHITIENLRILGQGGSDSIGLIGTVYTHLTNIYVNSYVSDMGNGYNRQMFYNYTTWIAGVNSHGGNAGGLYQVARNSADVYVDHSSFLNYRGIVITGVAMNEGSYNVHINNSQFIGLAEVAAAAQVPSSGFEVDNNDFYDWETINGQGFISTICCGSAPIGSVVITRNRIHSTNTREPGITAGGPNAIIANNQIDSKTQTASFAINLNSISGGTVIGNTVNSPYGIAVSGHTDFQIVANTLNGNGTEASTGILFNENSTEPIGPNVGFNNINGYINGIRGNSPSNFPNRQIGFNTVTCIVATYANCSDLVKYTAGYVPLDFDGSCSEVLIMSPCNAFITNGLSLVGQFIQTYTNGASGVTPTAGAAQILDGPGNNLRESLVPNGACDVWQVRNPTIRTYIQSCPGVSINFGFTNSNPTNFINPYGTQEPIKTYADLVTIGCSAPSAGYMVIINNSGTASGMGNITGTGGNFVLAVCNGTNWTAH